jgi:hypothetical protein
MDDEGYIMATAQAAWWEWAEAHQVLVRGLDDALQLRIGPLWMDKLGWTQPPQYIEWNLFKGTQQKYQAGIWVWSDIDEFNLSSLAEFAAAVQTAILVIPCTSTVRPPDSSTLPSNVRTVYASGHVIDLWQDMTRALNGDVIEDGKNRDLKAAQERARAAEDAAALLRDQVTALTQREKLLSESLADATASNGDIAQLRTDLVDAQLKTKTAQEKLKKTQKELKLSREEVTALQAGLYNMEERVKKLVTEAASATAAKSEMELQRNTANAESVKWKALLQQVSEEKRRQDEELLQRQASAKRDEARAVQAEAQARALAQQVELLTKNTSHPDMAVLQEQLLAFKAQIDQLHRRISESDERYTRSLAEEAEHQTKLAKDLAASKELVESLRVQLTAAKQPPKPSRVILPGTTVGTAVEPRSTVPTFTWGKNRKGTT